MDNGEVKLSRVDELCVRKIMVEKWLNNYKEVLEDRAMYFLPDNRTDEIDIMISGQMVFYERWIKDLDKEIEPFELLEKDFI